VLKETLTIKPDGLQDQGAAAHGKRSRRLFGRGTTTTAASSAAATPRARTRPGTHTPLLVLYGSNLGTAENLQRASPIWPRSMVFGHQLAALDDFVGRLPEQGGVLISSCASYNGAPARQCHAVRQMARQRPVERCVRKSALRGVRCGNSDWLATYQSIPRFIDEQLAAHGASNAYVRGEGDARDDLVASSNHGSRNCARWR